MKKFLYKAWAKFLTAFGDIKIFNWPLFMVYDDSSFKVAGDKILEIMTILKPGDIVLHGYDNYLDGKFIPDKLKFSHGAIYIGDNLVIHSVAEGASVQNIVDYCQCDRVAILRPKSGVKHAIIKAKAFARANIPYDFGFSRGSSALYCFELCAECYDKLDIQKCTVSKFFGLITKDVYIAESFFKSKDLKCVFHWNPMFNIDLVVS